LAWADQLSPDELEALLGKYESEMQMQISMLQMQQEQSNISPSGTPRDAYINLSLARTPREATLWRMIQENWISFYQNELAWVRNLRQQLGG
jgi:PadR family transcriptional regulator, regulatory protein AphA